MILQKDGILTTYQGDSFTISFNITGLDSVSLYSIYFQVNFPEPIIKQIEVTTDQEGNCRATFNINRDETEVEVLRYSYGVKACRDSFEDTIHTGYLEIKNKYVEGVNG